MKIKNNKKMETFSLVKLKRKALRMLNLTIVLL